MKKILEGSSRRVGTILSEIDTNFIEVCNNILKISHPDLNLLGYAIAETEPTSPTLNDAYLVREDETIWEIVSEKNDIIFWNGTAWEVLAFKITQINAAIQYNFFDSDRISVETITGLVATDVQAALEEIAAALVTHGILTA